MTRPWLNPSTGTAAQTAQALADLLPMIETERLILRAPRIGDFAVLEPIWTTERAAFIGGPMEAEDGWLDFNQMIASWLLRGFGALTVTARADGAVLGLVSIDHEWGDPEPEIGWLLTEEAEGHGYGQEASAAILAYGLDLLGPGTLVAYVEDGNDRSARLATAIGGVRDALPHPLDAEVAVYRFGEARP